MRQWIAALLPECAGLLPATPEHGPAAIASQTDTNTSEPATLCSVQMLVFPRTAAWCRASGGGLSRCEVPMQPEIRLPFLPSRPLVFCLLLAALLLLAACHGTDTGAGHRH